MTLTDRARKLFHTMPCHSILCTDQPYDTETPRDQFTPRYVAETAERRKNVSQADLSYPAMTLMQYERMMDSSDDIFKSNPDIPQAQASLEWGMSDPNYHTLFASEMDKRDFQERCYNPQNSQKLYRLEQRHTDTKPWHLQIERIMGWMDCDFQTAHAFSDCFEKLSMDRQAVVKLVFGFGPKRKGIKGTGIKHLPLLMQMVDETEAVSHIPDEDAMNFISQSGDDVEAIGQVFQKLHRYGCEAVEEDFELTEDFLYQNEKEDVSFNSSVFTAKELGRDELSLDDDLIHEIATAKWDDLKIIVKRMFSEHVENEYGGYWKPPVYRNKYPSWISDFWLRIADRKKAIIKLAYRYKVQPTLQENFKFLKQIKSAKQRWFMAQTMIKGGTFSFNGKKIQFTKCQPHERVVIEYALSIVNKKLANK